MTVHYVESDAVDEMRNEIFTRTHAEFSTFFSVFISKCSLIHCFHEGFFVCVFFSSMLERHLKPNLGLSHYIA